MTRTKMTRRAALAGAAGVAAMPAKAQLAAPAVRRKVKLSYWNWADNPDHLKISTEAVRMFNAGQNLIEVELNANMANMETRNKLVVAFAAGAAPDVCNTAQYWVQDFYDSGILQPLGDYFDRWDERTDFFPNIVEQIRSKPGQPVLYLPQTSIPYFLYYRGDWLKQAGLTVPDTFDEYIALTKALTHAPDRYGIAMRGQTYSAVQVITPIWRSAGVLFADDKGNVDFDSPAAISVTEKWVGMFTKDHSAQPTAINDGYRELFALMEQGRCGTWFYGTHASPALFAALGDTIQGTQNPRVGSQHYMLANPEGPMMVTSCKEKDAAWEFMKFIASGPAVLLFTAERAVPPVRKSLAQNPAFQNNRVIKMALAVSDTWWTPPYQFENWTNFQDKIPPYWQEVLQQKITPEQFNKQGAALLRGEG